MIICKWTVGLTKSYYWLINLNDFTKSFATVLRQASRFADVHHPDHSNKLAEFKSLHEAFFENLFISEQTFSNWSPQFCSIHLYDLLLILSNQTFMWPYSYSISFFIFVIEICWCVKCERCYRRFNLWVRFLHALFHLCWLDQC